jgi:hypothetical protein
MFTSYEKNDDPNNAITFGDVRQGKLKGFGKIAITTDHSTSNVFLPNPLDCNLLSVSQSCENCYNCLFIDKGVTIFRSSIGSVAFNSALKGKLYLVYFSKSKFGACLIVKINMRWLCHRRLAHVGMKNLRKLIKGEHV